MHTSLKILTTSALHQSRSNLYASSTLYIIVWGHLKMSVTWESGQGKPVSLQCFFLAWDVTRHETWHCWWELHPQRTCTILTWGAPEHEKKWYMTKITCKSCKQPREAGTLELAGDYRLMAIIPQPQTAGPASSFLPSVSLLRLPLLHGYHLGNMQKLPWLHLQLFPHRAPPPPHLCSTVYAAWLRFRNSYYPIRCCFCFFCLFVF